MAEISSVSIITPCYNEEKLIVKFIEELEGVLKAIPKINFTIIIIDDGSTDNTVSLIRNTKVSTTNVKLMLLPLRFNTGHQEAIYQGILFANNHCDSDRYIVMDSDGEDDPTAIASLVKMPEYDIVHVVRGKRKESLKFRLFYGLYKLIFKMITGKQMNFGNFCMINAKVLDTIATKSFIHFAAKLSRLRVKSNSIIVDRRKRIDGHSKMNLNSLLYHGFRSFVEYSEELLLIFLKLACFISVFFTSLVGYILYLKVIGDATPGWASNLSAALLGTAIMCFGFFTIGLLLINIYSKNSGSPSELYQQPIDVVASLEKKESLVNRMIK